MGELDDLFSVYRFKYQDSTKLLYIMVIEIF